MLRNYSILALAGLLGSMGICGQSTFGAVVDTESLLASGTHTYSNNTGGAIFSLNALQPAGSGVFDPFVRIQGSKTDVEQGYNSSDDSTLDNHPIGPGDYLLPMNTVVSPDQMVKLLLDANEPSAQSKSQIVLTDLMLVVSTNPNKSGTGAAGSQYPVPLDTGDMILYHMNTTTDSTSGNPFQVLIDANDRLGTGNGGSGQADLEVLVDLSSLNLTGLLDANHYLYVYSAFSNYDAGYEEWRAAKFDSLQGTGVPEPASLGLLGAGAVGLLARRRRR